jgi:hypothetical protein
LVKKCAEKKIMKKKKKIGKNIFLYYFLSKTTVNPLRKQNPYHGNKTLTMVTTLTEINVFI